MNLNNNSGARANPDSPANYPLDFTGVVPVAFTLNGGTATYITTSIAAAVPPDAKVIECVCLAGGVGPAGMRLPGSGLARYINFGGASYFAMSSEINPQSVDLYDSTAGANVYTVTGYWS